MKVPHAGLTIIVSFTGIAFIFGSLKYKIMRSLFLFVATICSFSGMAQCKTFKISPKGDTLNCIDQKDLKQGKWTVHVDALRGNPGYDEQGVYLDDRKDGVWTKYNLMGDVIALQNYKWGNLDGISQYFTVAGLEREESWMAMNPNKAYDTFDVKDIDDDNKYIQVILKNDGKSLKNGTWKWFRPGSMSIVRSEVYILNKLQVPKQEGDEATAVKKPEPKKEKPKEVEQFEKKLGKKGAKVKDGKTGG